MLTAEGDCAATVSGGVASHVERSAYVHMYTSVHVYTSRKRDKTLSPLAHRKRRVAAMRESTSSAKRESNDGGGWPPLASIPRRVVHLRVKVLARDTHARTHVRACTQARASREYRSSFARARERERERLRSNIVATRERCGHYEHVCTHEQGATAEKCGQSCRARRTLTIENVLAILVSFEKTFLNYVYVSCYIENIRMSKMNT